MTSVNKNVMTSKQQTQIVEIEERLRQAMLCSDVNVLDELIAPELIFTNHLGQLVSKRDDLAFHKSGALRLNEFTASEQHIQLHNGFAVVSVLMHLLGTYESKPIDFSIRYTRVWSTTSNGSMQVVAGHASAIPPN